MSEPVDSTIPRRTVIKAAGAGATVLATSAAAAATTSAVAAPTACASTGTHVVTALGPTTSTYSPALSAIPQAVTVTQDATYSEPCDDNPSLLLVADHSTAFLPNASCTGAPSTTSAAGTLTWNDGTHSPYTIDVSTVIVVRVNGQGISKSQGTINADAAHYPGALITRMNIRKAGAVTACLTGGTVADSSGYGIVEIVK